MSLLELARQKAADGFLVFTTKFMTKIVRVIGADTVVSYTATKYSASPPMKQEALDMLSMLADRTHQVYTGVAHLIWKNGTTMIRTFCERTEVTFYPVMTARICCRYIATGDPMDKAGAYGIQGDFAIHVKAITWRL